MLTLCPKGDLQFFFHCSEILINAYGLVTILRTKNFKSFMQRLCACSVLVQSKLTTFLLTIKLLKQQYHIKTELPTVL